MVRVGTGIFGAWLYGAASNRSMKRGLERVNESVR